MCGISGYYNTLGQSNRPYSLRTSEQILNHRGPDNFGIYEDNDTCLAHNRLSLLDLSEHGNQPFENEDCVLIYNGEIYNYLDIKHKFLSDKDVRFVSGSDTEVLFHLLQHYPVQDVINELEGMFAFAYYNKRSKKLILGRDKLGIKPLFYMKGKSGDLFFASEMKAFMAFGDLGINDYRIFYSLYGMYDAADGNTVFNNVFHVRPGHYLEVSGNNIAEHRYFKLTDLVDAAYYQQQSKKQESEIFEEFDHILTQNISSMLMSDAPMGIFASGGIDSSLVAAVANKLQPIELFTANVVGKFSEVDDARMLANHLGMKLHEHNFMQDDFIRDFTECTWHMETPMIIHANAVPFSGVARLAHSKGVKAVLTGEGSDELFLGYPYLLTKRYDGLIKGPANLVNWMYKKVPGLSKYVLKENENSINSALINIAKQYQRQRIKEDNNSLQHIPEKERHDQFLSLRMMQEHLLTLLWRNDRMGMIASIESRFPFLGTSMMKFAFNLPLKYKIGQTSRFHNYKHPFLIDKRIVREASVKHLNKHLVYKKKNGFPLKGLSYLRTDTSFFKDGVLQTSAGLRNEDLQHFMSSTDSYTMGKFIALETFHKLYVQRKSKEEVQQQFMSQVKLV